MMTTTLQGVRVTRRRRTLTMTLKISIIIIACRRRQHVNQVDTKNNMDS